MNRLKEQLIFITHGRVKVQMDQNMGFQNYIVTLKFQKLRKKVGLLLQVNI